MSEMELLGQVQTRITLIQQKIAAMGGDTSPATASLRVNLQEAQLQEKALRSKLFPSSAPPPVVEPEPEPEPEQEPEPTPREKQMGEGIGVTPTSDNQSPKPEPVPEPAKPTRRYRRAR